MPLLPLTGMGGSKCVTLLVGSWVSLLGTNKLRTCFGDIQSTVPVLTVSYTNSNHEMVRKLILPDGKSLSYYDVIHC